MALITLADGSSINLPGLTYAQLRTIFVSNGAAPAGVTETTGWVEFAANLTLTGTITTVRKANVVRLEPTT